MAFRTQFLHFDSSTSTYLTDTNSSTGVTLTPYKALFPMNETYTKIKRVYLKSLEMPVGYTNVSTGSTSRLQFTLNGTAYTVNLSEKNYTSVTVLVADLNSACVGIVTNVTITFSVTTSLTTPNRLIVTFSGVTATTSFSMTNTNLSKYILGFRSTDALVSSVVSASCNINLNPDNTIFLHIPVFNGINAHTSGIPSTFKIPLNSIYNQTYFYNEESSFYQFVDITDPNIRVKDIVVTIYDKYGLNLNSNGNDYSFTLALELWL